MGKEDEVSMSVSLGQEWIIQLYVQSTSFHILFTMEHAAIRRRSRVAAFSMISGCADVVVSPVTVDKEIPDQDHAYGNRKSQVMTDHIRRERQGGK